MTTTAARRITTMDDTTVEIVKAADEHHIVIKTAHTPAAIAMLDDCARHLRAFAAIPALSEHYPPILDHAHGTMTMPYYQGGTLEAVSDPIELSDRLRAAITTHLRISSTRALTGHAHRYAGLDGARRFWRDQLQARLHRLAGTGFDMRRPPIPAITAWAGHGLDATLTATVTRPLALAAHGDLAMANIVLDGPHQRFIDLRGVWAGGLPWWDPVLDAASMIAFDCLIKPALGIGRADPPSPEHITTLFAQCAPAGWWETNDPRWRDRLAVGLIIRQVGSIGTQLTTAPSDRESRAENVLAILRNTTREAIA